MGETIYQISSLTSKRKNLKSEGGSSALPSSSYICSSWKSHFASTVYAYTLWFLHFTVVCKANKPYYYIKTEKIQNDYRIAQTMKWLPANLDYTKIRC